MLWHLQYSRIPEPIKPAKVLTISNDLSQIFFWKNISPFGNKNSKFEKTVISKSPQHELISKIPLHDWQAWKSWFLTIVTFLAPVTFWSFFQISWIKKMAGAKKFNKAKNQFYHARQPRERILEIRSHWDLIFTTNCLNFEELFLNFETCFQNNFGLKSLLMASTITG